MTKTKKAAIACGVILGVSASLIAMLPTSKSTKAAVAVFDAENVAKAVEIVTNTINIYNTAVDSLNLEKINMKHIDPNILGDIFKKQDDAKKTGTWLDSHAERDIEILKEQGITPSILNKNTTPEQILMNEMGDVNEIFKMGATIPEMHLMAQNNGKALDASYKSAATASQSVQASDAQIDASVKEALDAAANAEGDMQVQQSLVALSAANVRATENGNQLLAQLVATQAQTGYADNLERAAVEQLEESSRQKLRQWIEKW